jgi:hypothetical protein
MRYLSKDGLVYFWKKIKAKLLSIENRIDALEKVQVGETNLIIGSSLQYTTTPSNVNWSTVNMNEVDGAIYTKDGLCVLTPNSGIENNGIGFKVLFGNKYSFGDTVTFSVDVKGSNSTGKLILSAWSSSPSSQFWWANEIKSVKKSFTKDVFTRYAITITVPSAMYSGEKWVLFGIAGGLRSDYTIRNIKLSKGNVATDWSPAPEDIDFSALTDEQISILKAKLGI